MNWLDIVLIVLLGFSTLQSFRKGFSREIIGLAASLFALVAGMWFYGLAGSFVSPYVGSARVANLLGFFMVVICVLVVGALIAWIISRFLRTMGLSFFDRLLGAVFGLLRGLLIAVALLTAFTAFGWQAAPRALVNSRIAPYILEASRYFVAIAPMDLKQTFHQQYLRITSEFEESHRESEESHRNRRSGSNEGKF